MGKKINPISFRTNTTFKQRSRWFATGEDYAANVKQDVELRKYFRKKFRDGSVASIEIERSAGEVLIVIYTAKPGVIIGRGGAQIEETREEVKRKFFGSVKMKVTINIQEVKDPDLNAELVYQNIRDQIENRVPFRRAIKRGLENVVRAQAKGCKIQISGRLNGADIARTETVSAGRLPLHTLRANIDYSRGVAHTTYGVIGIKVWIYKGDVFGDEVEEETKKKKRPAKKRRPRKKKYDSAGGKKGPILRKKSDIEADKKK